MKLKVFLVTLFLIGATSSAFAKKPASTNSSQSTGIPVCDRMLELSFKCTMNEAKTEKQKNDARKKYAEAKNIFKTVYKEGDHGVIEHYTQFCQAQLVQFQTTGCKRADPHKSRPGEDIF